MPGTAEPTRRTPPTVSSYPAVPAAACFILGIALHAKLGFIEVGRDIDVPSVTFTGGAGVLFRRDLSAE